MDDQQQNITDIATLQRKKEMSMVRPERQLDMPPPKREELCPTCKWPLADASYGWVKDAYDMLNHKTIMKPCPTCSGGIKAKSSARLINELFGDAHIPHYATDWTFGSYPASGDQSAKARVLQFVSHNLAGTSGKRGLYLVGETGQGKTSLAIAALQHVIKKGHSGVFMTTLELFGLLRGAIAASRRIERGDGDYEDRYEQSQGAKLLRLVKTVEWLVLDDLGVEGGSKYIMQQLYAILEERRGHGLYTIFTSNRTAPDLQQYWRDEKEGVFQDALRIIDRIGEYCLTVPVASKQNLRQRAQ